MVLPDGGENNGPAERDNYAGVTFLTQTKLLFVKNWRTKIRSEPKKLLGEIFIPVLYLILLSFLVRLDNPKTYPEVRVSYETPQSVESSLNLRPFPPSSTPHKLSVHIVPENQEVLDVTGKMSDVWKSITGKDFNETVDFVFYPNTTTLMEAYYQENSSVEMAVVFSSGNLYSYSIRIDPANELRVPSPSVKKSGLETCRSREKLEAGLENTGYCPVNGYYYSNYLALQYLVDQALILKYNSSAVLNNVIPIKIENYPKPEYTAGMSTFLRVVIPLYCIIPLAQLVNMLLILIVTEKESKIKDGLKMIGVSDAAYWFSWFGIYSIMVAIYSIMFTIVLHVMNVLKNLNPVILFLLFFLFGLSIITFAFALTPFFHKPKTAGAVGTLIMQFTGMLFLLQTFLKNSSSTILIPLRLISSLSFTAAIDEACEYEYFGGISIHDIWPGEKGAGIFYSLFFLLFDIIFYGLLAIYLDNIIPNEYGVRKSPFYCLKCSFWFGSRRGNLVDSNSDLHFDTVDDINSEDVEQVHPSLNGKEAIRIHNLKKTYGSWPSTNIIQAVKSVSLNIYEGQITAILGRNGAGKSTLVNMMTGLVMPTNGRCTVFGMDISDPFDMARLRRMTGVCMQQDLHFDALTVQEHLEFYGKLRGIPKNERTLEINTLLDELQLLDQKGTTAGKLSGGQKRKLSVAMALIGSPKIILLDEPSAGVDPVSRRHLWSLLQKKKSGRVIILTTHFMDEADILADRKAIIQNGRLKCVGSSLFLKNRFGVGYYLSVEMDDNIDNFNQSDAVVEKWVPGAKNSRKTVGNEVKYALPYSQVQQFSKLFGDLENLIQSNGSGVKSYGVSMTTLEEVFLKISNDEEAVPTIMPHRRSSELSLAQGVSLETNTVNQNPEPIQEQNLIPDVGRTKSSAIHVFWAMCVLRIRRLVRNPLAMFFIVIMPIILVAVGFGLTKTQSISVDQTKLTFSTLKNKDIYPETKISIAVSGNVPEEFKNHLITTGFNPLPYSGIYADLLNVKSESGSMSAVSFLASGNAFPQRNEIRLNGTYIHVPGIILNLLAQYTLSNGNTSSPQIMTENYPLPNKKSQVFDQSSLYAVFLIGPAFTFLAVGMVMELVKDREIKARNHLRVNGLSLETYFGSIFLVYGILSFGVTLAEVIVVYAFQVEAFTNPYAITVVITLLVLYILPCLLFSAIFSYLFDRMESAQSVFSQISSWMGSIAGLAMIIVDATVSNKSIPFILHVVFSATDVFYIPFGIFYWTNKQYISCTIMDTCDKINFSTYLTAEFLVMGIAMVLQTFVFLVLLIAADITKNGGNALEAFRILKIMRRRQSGNICVPLNDSNLSNENENDDDDVTKEKLRTHAYFSDVTSNTHCVVAVKDLRKSYRAKKQKGSAFQRGTYQKEVLHGVSFMVEEGEVFGLLGHNGAGKTSTIKIIIAEEKADSGKVRLCGSEINSNVSEAFSKLGYCPQHDALWDNITLREHLELYALIRGIQPNLQSKLVNHLMKGLQISEHSQKKTSTLSGGTKRKLSYCMSMINPKIVLLDEPSSGMDVMSKRFLWNTILGTFKDSRGAILTTHSMEEADALCTRIAIMVKGSLLCIGSPQHLKTKYGAGYTLEIKLKTDANEVESEISADSCTVSENRFYFVKQHFPGSTLSEIFVNRAVFSLPNSSIQSVSQTFALLEELKLQNNIEEYSFSQTTLEQVFLQFAKEDDVSRSASPL